MLKSVIIFWSHGRLLYSKTYGVASKDPHLVSGFLAALTSFAKELGEKEIRSITMQPHKIFMSLHQDLCFTMLLDQDVQEAHGTLILESLIDSFLSLYGEMLDPTQHIELSIFKTFEPILDDLNIIKNFFALIESSNKILSIPQLQKMYDKKYNDEIPLTQCWQSLNFLVLKDVIVKVTDGYTLGYRKKGELLKKFGLKFKR